jgi:hypothetical protein
MSRTAILGFCVALTTPALAHAEIPPHLGGSFDFGVVQAKTVTPLDRDTFVHLPYLGVTGRAYLGPIVTGVRVEWAHDMLFGRGEYVGAGFAGLHLADEQARLDVTAEIGGHLFVGVGDSLVQSVTSPSVALPTVGAQARLGWATGRNRRESVGLTMFVRRDLDRARITAVDNDAACFLWCTHDDHEYEVGGTTIGLGIAVQYDGLQD